jgi:predicted protein tyrosine phosphatase
VDIVGGFVLAAFCFYLFREERERNGFIPNRKVGGYYAGASLVCLAAAFAAWPWTGILLWPALSLGITAAGYWHFGPAIYRKTHGRLPLSARLILAPNMFGQYLSLLWYRRRCDAWSEVIPGVWIGAQLSQQEALAAKQAGAAAVLDLTTEFSEPNAFRSLAYFNIPVLDLTELSAGQLRAAVDVISRHAGAGAVYVHCKVGYSRSAAAVGAFLIASGRAANVEEALEILRRARPGIIFRPEVFAALEKFCCGGRANGSLPETPAHGAHCRFPA